MRTAADFGSCYLSPDEQDAFFRKLAREHAGISLLSAPIIGANEYRTYFTDGGIRQTFAHHGLDLVEARNLNAYRKAGLGATIAAAMCRLPFGSAEPHSPILRFSAISAVGRDRDIEMNSEKVAGILGAIVASAALVIAIAYGPIGQMGKPQKPVQRVEQPALQVVPPTAPRGPVVREVPQQ
jgi:hypothetical protein